MTKSAKNPHHVLFASSQPEVLWKKSSPLLKAIDIELTERCNNNCRHCCINLPEHDMAAQAKEMTTAQCKDILRQAADLGALTVRFTGGEPLLRNDFEELYLFARRLGMRVLLFTNGRLISPAIADLFSRIPPIERIELTVYGMTQATYEAVTRKKNSFAEFKAGLNRLLERKIPFFVKGTLFPENRHEINDFLSWAKRLPWMDSLPSFAMFLELRHRRDSMIKNKQIAKMRMTPDEGIKILTMQPELYREEMIKFCKNFLSQPTDMIFNCNASNTICIDAYGKIQYCLALRHPNTVLDSRQYSLEHMVKKFIPELRSRRSRNADFLKRCANCFLRNFCEGCPGKSWNEYGSLDQPVDYWCQIAHQQARYLKLIADEENA